MQIKVHLLAMPWSFIGFPSIQIGALKSYLDQHLGGQVEVQSYSAFLRIPFLAAGADFQQYFSEMDSYEEYTYALLYLRDFERHRLDRSGMSWAELQTAVWKGLKGRPQLKNNALEKLREATSEYVKSDLEPRLASHGIHWIGFTLNYNQVFASAYLARSLMTRYPEKRFCFVFGGMSAALPNVMDLFRELGIPAFCVLGEGERKAEAMIRALQSLPEGSSEAQIIQCLTSCMPGILHTSQRQDLWVKDKAAYENQIADLSTLPPPDYREFFSVLRDLCEDESAFELARSQCMIHIEGTRGCFAKCAFCGLNYLWSGFRKMPADAIHERFVKLVQEYGVQDVNFVDNVCDSWAEAFADRLIQEKNQVSIFMELRAHHPEIFWTKLALAGVTGIQIGVEALSPHLLKIIRKGTRVIQNLTVQKYLKELGIRSVSNLITHYPGSTLEDVRETKRVLSLISHFDGFDLPRFGLAMGSPLFESLPVEEKRKLVPTRRVDLPEVLRPFVLDYGFVPPQGWLDDSVCRAWDEFIPWYLDLKERSTRTGATLSARRDFRGRIILSDSRDGSSKEHVLDGDLAQVYDLCHRGVQWDPLLAASSLSESRLRAVMDELLSLGVLIEADGHFLSLALRPREELVARYYDREGLGATGLDRVAS